MDKKKIYLNTNSVLENFYNAVKENRLGSLHIPHSDVFYVRRALQNRTGISFSLKQIETAMKAEGWNK
tara:strand:+ start:1949 stop:2152 length:204 start_codon:yes stop_codon:yes gene_type:complete